MDVLKIDGVVMPPIKSLTISREPIWSKNAGRGADGTMIGDIVAQKLKLQITFAPMSDEKAKLLDNAILPAFFSATFRNPGTGEMTTKEMYAGSPAYPVYSYVNGLPRYSGVGVNLVEK